MTGPGEERFNRYMEGYTNGHRDAVYEKDAEIDRLRACIKFVDKGEGVNWDDEIISLRLDNQRLRARAAEVVDAWQREDDSIGEAIEVLGRALQPRKGER